MEVRDEMQAEFSNLELNGNLSFECFVLGMENQQAFFAAKEFVEAVNVEQNVLFIHGEHGVGKTHLAHATANLLKSIARDAKICVMSGKSFVSDVVRAYRSKSFEKFRKEYRSLDLLVIDDIDCLDNKARTQEELIHILDGLHLQNTKFLATSSFPLGEFSGFENRLLSRLHGGLAVKMGSSAELLLEIAKRRARSLGHVLEDDAALFLVKNAGSDIRHIEGALNRVVAFEKRRPLTLDLVKLALMS